MLAAAVAGVPFVVAPQVRVVEVAEQVVEEEVDRREAIQAGTPFTVVGGGGGGGAAAEGGLFLGVGQVPFPQKGGGRRGWSIHGAGGGPRATLRPHQVGRGGHAMDGGPCCYLRSGA